MRDYKGKRHNKNLFTFQSVFNFEVLFSAPDCTMMKLYIVLLENTPKGENMSHNRDKEKKEQKKKAQHDLKEKRKLRKEKKQHITPITLPSHS